jgi:hypothetical protein
MGNRSARRLVAAGALLALGALAGCSGGSGNSDAMSGSGGSVSADRAEPAPASEAEAGLKAAPGVDRAAVRTASVIRTAELSITARDLGAVRADVDSLLAAVGGSIGTEQTTPDRKGRVQSSTLVLRVPVDRFAATKKALMGMGRLETSDESAKDVTSQVIDVDERVQTLQNSLDDLQRYQRGARDVKDLLDFEEKITERQAELQSLKAQQSYLDDQTSLATITVHLSTPEKYVPPPDALKDAGFLSGLKAGWNALGDAVVVALTVLGALLPFLLAGALVGVPTWIAVKALLRRRTAPDSP